MTSKLQRLCRLFSTSAIVVILLTQLPSASERPNFDSLQHSADYLSIKLVVRKPVEQGQLANAGVEVMEDYGSFFLCRATQHQLLTKEFQHLWASASMEIRPEMDEIRLAGYIFNSFLGEPELPSEFVTTHYEHEEEGLYLVQFVGPIKERWINTLKAAGAHFLSYVPSTAYIVRASFDVLVLAKVFEPAVQWAGIFHPAYKLHPKLDLDTSEIDVIVHILDGSTTAETVELINAATLKTYMQDYHVLNQTVVRRRLPTEFMKRLALLSDVLSIAPWREPVLLDEVQCQITAGNYLPPGPSAPGYEEWLVSKGLENAGSVIVDIADDGFDTGDITEGMHHPDFDDPMTGESRVTYAFEYTGDGPWGMGGHGTINQAIVAGNGDGTGMLDEGGYLYGHGICPSCLTGQSKVFKDAGGFTSTPLDQIVGAAHDAGARITSNSWGWTHSSGEYNSDSQLYDILTRDANNDLADGLQPMIVVFAAGNDGSGSGTVSPPSTAKNVLAVGASENYRMTGTDGCGIGNSDADHFNDVVSFSSRGPVLDGRLKPEVVAPGTHIQGAASQYANYDGSSVCNQYWPTGQTMYAWSSGTSHSTPAAAGAVALIYHDYNVKNGSPPSPAMAKAILAGTVDDMVGGNNGAGGILDNQPDMIQGWGRINLGTTFDGTSNLYYDQDYLFIATGQTYSPMPIFSVVDPLRPVKVVLVWSDAPGSTLTPGGGLNNDLDLSVTADGGTYLGNNFLNGYSQTGGVANTVDNIEAVFLPPGAATTFTVTVTASNISSDGIPGNDFPLDQDFAIFIYNATDQTSDGVIFLDKPIYSCADTINIVVSDSDLHDSPPIIVTVSSTTEATPENVTLTEDPVGSGVMRGFITTSSGVAEPDGVLQVSDLDIITATYMDADDGMGGIDVPKMDSATADCAPPIITNVQVTNITDNSATVTWETDEIADSNVTWGADPPPGNTTYHGAMMLSHSVMLTDLAPCTNYVFQVSSSDPYGNSATDDNLGVYYSFTTVAREVIFQETFDSDPGWDTTGDWAFGQPQGGVGSYGNPDPISGYTGDNVYGNDISPSATYDNNAVDYALTMPAMDFTGIAGAQLEFYRWLNVEQPTYDQATVEINNGAGWQVVWTNLSVITDTDWALQQIDISEYADNQPSVQIRWNLNTDGSWDYTGWNIDDVAITYLRACGDGTISLDERIYNCNDTITITVNDSDLNSDPGMQETTTVTIVSSSEPSGETVLLQEAGINANDFVGSIATNGNEPVQDGILQIATSDAITAIYIDADNGQGGLDVPKTANASADCSPPVIADLQIVDVTATSAEVTWTTSEDASASVVYDTVKPPSFNVISQPVMLTIHSIVLTDLNPCTTYYLYVRSTDVADNTATDDNGGIYYSFTTLNGVTFSEDFNAGLPGTWTVVNGGSGTDTWTDADTCSRGIFPDTYMIVDSDCAGTGVSQDEQLITSVLDFSGSQSVILEFDHYLNYLAGESVEVHVRSSKTGGAWILMASYTEDVIPIERESIDMTAEAAGASDVQVRWHYYDASYEWYWALDNIVIKGLGHCGPFVMYQSHTLSDCGYEDGIVDPGERIWISPALRNTGIDLAQNVTAVLSSNTPGVSVLTNIAAYPDIAIGATEASIAPYVFEVEEATVCGSLLDFVLSVSGQDSEGALFSNTDDLEVMVGNIGGPEIIFSENLDSDPSWAMTGDWAFGVPQGLVGSYGNPDPTSGYTGSYVCGNDIAVDGVYDNDATNYTLTTPIINCSEYKGTTLEFYRWLNVETATYDHATVEIDNGTGWQVVWQNPTGAFTDGSWNLTNIDVSAYADNQPNVQIRWNLNTDGSVQYTGWNIDDITISGVPPPFCHPATCGEPPPPTEISAMGATQALVFTNKIDILWEEAAASNSDEFNLYRGTLSALSPMYYGTCLQSGIPSNTWTDGTAPSPGEGYFYIVTGRNAAGEGSMGYDSGGHPRPNTEPCP